MTTPTPATPAVSFRPATSADVDAIVAALTTAFFDDPLWGPAFPDVDRRAEQAAAFWRLFVTSGQRFGWTRVTGQVEAAAVWIPPGESELTEAEAADYPEFVADLVGPAAAEVIVTIGDQFEAARPSEPHYYLSLLATHSDHRGAGLGMALLRESLARIDDLRLPAYLESSNPANLPRYRSVGFVPRQEIVTPSGHTVTTMWRPAP